MRSKSLNELKADAIAYYSNNDVPQNIEKALNLMFAAKPEDRNGYLSTYFENLCKSPSYQSICLTDCWNVSRGALSKLEVYGSWKGAKKILASVVYTNEPLGGSVSQEGPFHDIQNTTGTKATLDTWDFKVFFADQLQPRLYNHVIDLDLLLEMDVLFRSIYDGLVVACPPAANQAATMDAKEPVENTKLQVAENRNKSAGTTSSRRSKTKGGRSVDSAKTPPVETVPVALPAASDLSALSTVLFLAASNSFNPPIPPHIFAAELRTKLYKEEEALSKQPTEGGVFRGRLPLPVITIFNGPGSEDPFATGKCKCIQELWIIPKPDISPIQICSYLYDIKKQVMRSLLAKPKLNSQIAGNNGASSLTMDRPEQGLDLVIECMEACHLRDKFLIGMKLSGESIFDELKRKYEPIKGIFKTAEELTEFYAELVRKYPEIRILVNPFRKQDKDNWIILRELLGDGVLLSTSNIPEPVGPSSTTGPDLKENNQLERVRPPSGPGIKELLYGPAEKVLHSEDPATPPCMTATQEDSNATSKSGEPLYYNAWLFNVEPRLDICLVTESCKSILKMEAQCTRTICSVTWSKPDIWPVELAIGFGVNFVHFGGLYSDGAMTQLAHWMEIGSSHSDWCAPNGEECSNTQSTCDRPISYSWMSTFGPLADTEEM